MEVVIRFAGSRPQWARLVAHLQAEFPGERFVRGYANMDNNWRTEAVCPDEALAARINEEIKLYFAAMRAAREARGKKTFVAEIEGQVFTRTSESHDYQFVIVSAADSAVYDPNQDDWRKKEFEAGKMPRWGYHTWASRRDLAEKEAARARKYYTNVVILPVTVQEKKTAKREKKTAGAEPVQKPSPLGSWRRFFEIGRGQI